jgi:hypothetical protein
LPPVAAGIALARFLGAVANSGRPVRLVTIIEEAIGRVRHPPPFTDPWDVLEAGERFKAAMAEGFPRACPGQLETCRLPR